MKYRWTNWYNLSPSIHAVSWVLILYYLNRNKKLISYGSTSKRKPGIHKKTFHPKARTQLLSIKHYKEKSKRSEEHTSELQSRGHLVCRLLLENKNRGGH